MSDWSPQDDHYSFCLEEGTRRTYPIAAVAWRGDGVIAIELHEVMDLDGYEHFAARSMRLFRAPDGYPQRVPEGALKAAISAWRRFEQALFTTHADGGAVMEGYQPTDMRQPPYAEMRLRLRAEYEKQTRGEPFSAPNDDEIAIVQTDPKWLMSKGWTSRASKARLRELAAVGHYVSALASTSFPISTVAEAMGITDGAARNLLAGAREHGYLQNRAKGVSAGWATDLAVQLADEARSHAQRIRNTVTRQGATNERP